MTGLPELPISGQDSVPDDDAPLPKNSPGRGANGRPRLPAWFKAQAPGGAAYQAIKQTLRERGLATVCEQARCPNIGAVSYTHLTLPTIYSV